MKLHTYYTIPCEEMQNARIVTLSQVITELIPFLICAKIRYCLEHISKSIEGNLMKLDTLIEGYKGNCRMQEP